MSEGDPAAYWTSRPPATTLSANGHHSAGTSLQIHQQKVLVCRLVMASRCGDVDPAAVLYLLEHACGGDISKADKLLNKQSGLIGLTGHQDLKLVLEEAAAGKEDAATAAEVWGLVLYIFNISPLCLTSVLPKSGSGLSDAQS